LLISASRARAELINLSENWQFARGLIVETFVVRVRVVLPWSGYQARNLICPALQLRGDT
jgi:hypothetical protein